MFQQNLSPASALKPYPLAKKSEHLTVDMNNASQMIAPLDETDSLNDAVNEIVNSNGDEQPSTKSYLKIGIDMFKLLDKSSKKFILKPAQLGLTLKSQIFRQKGIFPQYRYYIENLDGNLLLIMTARKKKKSKTACYVINSISFDLNNIYKFIETPIAKLKSNLLGTQFCLYDFGAKPAKANNTLGPDDNSSRNRNNSYNGDSSEWSEDIQNR
jgi:hypothetical protein